jgi:transcription elongation factor Elf1
MSGHAKPPFTVGIEDLTCPVCDNESSIYVREDVEHDPDQRAGAMCDDCGAHLSVSVEMQPYFGDPKVVSGV